MLGAAIWHHPGDPSPTKTIIDALNIFVTGVTSLSHAASQSRVQVKITRISKASDGKFVITRRYPLSEDLDIAHDDSVYCAVNATKS